MDPKFDHSPEALENRFETWLAARPITPRPDFVARTLARIHAETSLLAAAKAGDDAAVEELLDRWLGEQPLSVEIEPEELVATTRQAAASEEFAEARPRETKERKTTFFPAWARSLGGLAVAAATVMIVSFFALQPQTNHSLPVGQPQVALKESAMEFPAHYAWVYQPEALLPLNESLSTGAGLLDSDNIDYLVNAEEEYSRIY